MSAFAPGVPTGCILPWLGYYAKIPDGWLLCQNNAISRTTYANLFSVVVPELGTVSITIATPAVCTITIVGGGNSIYYTGDAVFLTTTGSLPTGLTANTIYYVIFDTTNIIWLATSRANAYAGTKIATSGTQSGTHTIWSCPYGIGDGSTTFDLPNLGGTVLATQDFAQGNLTLQTSQGVYGNAGAVGGEQAHTLAASESGTTAHAHTESISTAGSGGSGYGISGGANYAGQSGANLGTQNSSAAAASSAHNNVQPTVVIGGYIIKT
jgi:microcystin-dependent protein